MAPLSVIVGKGGSVRGMEGRWRRRAYVGVSLGRGLAIGRALGLISVATGEETWDGNACVEGGSGTLKLGVGP